MPDPTLPLFAVTAPGLEPLCAAELRALGIGAGPEPGGVAWTGTVDDLHRANLWLRTASRVVLRVASFRARTFFELERHARKVPWERFVSPGRPVRLRVTSRKSKLYHEGAIAQRLLEAIDRAAGGIGAAAAEKGREEDEETGDAGEQLFVVRVLRDEFIVSADTSGALLHLRGYRQAVAKAPLRETLAAACLLGSGWDGRSPLLDPMCGSGTLAIEGALIARGIAPGLAHRESPRRYAFMEWPEFDAGRWRAVVDEAEAAARPSGEVPIVASDRDAGAVAAAEANAERAGVRGDLDLSVRALSAVAPPAGPGWLVTNPPYGARVGESDALRDLYAALGKVVRGRMDGWTVALLSADRRLEAQVGLRFAEAFHTSNGGIPVRLVVGRADD